MLQRRLQNAADIGTFLFAFAFGARYLHTLHRRECFHSGDKVIAVVFNNEIQRRAVRAATKAIVKTLFGIHRKRRRLFGMKRAQADMAASGFF